MKLRYPEEKQDRAPKEPAGNPPASSLSVQERVRLAKQKAREQQARSVEQAKDPALYEIYEHTVSDADPDLDLFRACKVGRRHVLRKMPCQDCCLTASGQGYTVLVDADGVSKSPDSREGAHFACEAVVQVVAEAAEQADGEEQKLVERLTSVTFRKRLIACWMKKVQQSADGAEDVKIDKLVWAHGTTILFAVITPHWYVAGNLGDGQVLLFNEEEGICLREHSRTPKASSLVYSVNRPTCAKEYFQIGVYPRSRFQGVLLTTDGIYDCLHGAALWQYALQLRERFLAQDPPEPLQPFCYQEPEGDLMDLSQSRSMDDCSIVLALDKTAVDPLARAQREALEKRCAQVMTWRLAGDCTTYYVAHQDHIREAVVIPAGTEFPFTRLESALLVPPKETWEEQGMHYAVYPVLRARTVEELYNEHALSRANAAPGLDCLPLVLYDKLMQLCAELKTYGCGLREGAPFLISYGNNTLYLKPEAVARPGIEPAGNRRLEACFDSLLGELRNGPMRLPLFDTGYYVAGPAMADPDVDEGTPFCRVYAEKKDYYLRNEGTGTWQTADRTLVQPGEKLLLQDGLTFTRFEPAAPDAAPTDTAAPADTAAAADAEAAEEPAAPAEPVQDLPGQEEPAQEMPENAGEAAADKEIFEEAGSEEEAAAPQDPETIPVQEDCEGPEPVRPEEDNAEHGDVAALYQYVQKGRLV